MKKFMAVMLTAVLCATMLSGCAVTLTPAGGDNATTTTEAATTDTTTDATAVATTTATSAQTVDPSTSAGQAAAGYQDRVENGWKLPTHADLLGTTWSFSEFTEDSRYVSYYLMFNEWTVDVRWNDGYDEEDHIYRDASYELTVAQEFAVLEIDFREMAGKLCFNLLISPDRQELYVTTDVSSGEPANGAGELTCIMTKENAPASTELIGEWDRFRVEVEGYEEDRPSGECTIKITSDDEGGLLISYYYPEFPDSEYENKPLLIKDGALHFNCGNNLWYAEVEYIGRFDTEFSLTLLEDGTLLLQNFYYLDGAPTVSYEKFKRIS